MKALVLSCSTGGGHNAAAKAVYEALRGQGIQAEYMDAFQLTGENTARRVGNFYVQTVQHVPAAFGAAYRLATVISSPRRKSPVYFANKLVSGKLEDYIRDNQIDVAVVSHLYPAETLTDLKANGKTDIPVIVVCTDYTCIPFWEETKCDAYILPHPELTEEYEKRGVPREKLFPYGIPVSQGFLQRNDREKARQLLGLAQKPTHLIMTGSMGYGHIGQLVREILDRKEKQHQIVVICGSNRKLYRELKEQFRGTEALKLVGFTTRVSAYMDAADVLYSKPGGLSSTEAIVKGIPLVHTTPIPGCETLNQRFFLKHGMSVSGETAEEEAKLGIRLIENGRMREKMLNAQHGNAFPKAADQVARLAGVMGREHESRRREKENV